VNSLGQDISFLSQLTWLLDFGVSFDLGPYCEPLLTLVHLNPLYIQAFNLQALAFIGCAILKWYGDELYLWCGMTFTSVQSFFVDSWSKPKLPHGSCLAMFRIWAFVLWAPTKGISSIIWLVMISLLFGIHSFYDISIWACPLSTIKSLGIGQAPTSLSFGWKLVICKYQTTKIPWATCHSWWIIYVLVLVHSNLNIYNIYIMLTL
jgi:hypothetical protein